MTSFDERKKIWQTAKEAHPNLTRGKIFKWKSDACLKSRFKIDALQNVDSKSDKTK